MTARRTSIALATSLGLAAMLVVSSCTAADDRSPTAPTSASSALSTAPGPGPAPSATTPDPASSRPTIPLTTARLTPAPAAIPPVRVVLSGHDIDVPVDPVGVQPDGQMEVPPLAERAGWYRYGSAPRDASGTTLVAAHVDSVASAGLGPFARLTDVAAGDPVEVTLADGSTVRYVVTAVETVAKSQVPWPDVFARDGPPRLVLVTCGGQFLRDRASYSDNVLVTAEPVVG